MMSKTVQVLAAALLLAACGGKPVAQSDGKLHVTLQLVREDGSAVVDGVLNGNLIELQTNANGEAELELPGPELLIASAPGLLPEPVIIGERDHRGRVQVRLWSSQGGTRRAMHFGGDVMFGRRYLTPSSGEPLLVPDEIEPSAARVVERIARAFAAADLSVVNLETVVSNLPLSAAYPGKRFLLNSPLESLAGLEKLGVDVVGLANNHTRDWLEPGLAATLEALDARGIPHVGAGLDEVSAEEPVITDLAGLRVATLAYTSVNGSYVNDNYPNDAVAMPESVSDKDAWIWNGRRFSSNLPGFSVESGIYRIGELWQRFEVVEDKLSEEQRAAVWAELTTTFPELQDWVARRGHGGAAYYVTSRVKASIAESKSLADVTVVLLHAGYQFQDVASETVEAMAHHAIDAGADLVVCHHPHVLQGVEYYQGRLIIYSLGNFVFDQDFLSTFSSGFLRTVWDGDRMLEARFLPVEIADYRPSVVADQAADRVFARLWESSLAPARAARVDSGVHPLLNTELGQPKVQLVREWGSVRFEPELDVRAMSLRAGSTVQSLPRDRLLRVKPGDSASTARGWSLGRELLGWGHFEDVLADGVAAFGQNYVVDHDDKSVVLGDAASGQAFLRLRRNSKKKDTLYVRPVARVPLPRHRLYETTGADASALDAEPTYSLRAMVRGSGDVRASFRVDCFHFDDSNPTEDPSSQALPAIHVPIERVGSRFEPQEIPIHLRAGADGTFPNMVMIYVGLAPPDEGESEFDVDEIEWVEWRSATALQRQFGAYNYAKNDASASSLSLEWVSLEP